MQRQSPDHHTLAVIRIPFQQDSVDYRAYAEPLAHSSVLSWAIGRLLDAMPPGVSTICVCASEREHERLVAAQCPDRLEIQHRSAPSEVQQCRDLMGEFKASRIIGLRLVHAVAPMASLLRTILQLHSATGATLTEASSPAFDLGVYVIDSSAIDVLHAADIRGRRTALFQAVADFRADLREPARESAAKQWFRLELPKISGIAAERWPESIRLESAADVRVLRDAIGESAPLQNGRPHYIDRWKSATISVRRDTQNRHRETARTHGPVVRSSTTSAASPRRVLYISGTSYFHGASRSLCHLIEGLDRQRYEPFVAIPFDGVLTTELRRRGATVLCPNENVELLDAAGLSLAGRLIQEVRPHIAHGNYTIGPPFIAALAAAGVPVVQHVRHPVFTHLTLEIHTATTLIAVSDLVKKRLTALDVAPDDVSVIWPGIDTKEFKRSPRGKTGARAALGLPQDDFIVAAIGRMTRYKHHETVVAALGKLRQATGRGHLLFVSALDADRGYYDEIFELIRKEDLTPHTTHIEFTEDIPTVLEASDTLAMMSKDEAFGRVAAEAMAVGLPVVVGDATGAAEVVEHGVDGFIVPYQSADALSSVLQEIAADPVRAERIGSAAAHTIQTRLSAARSAELTMAIYDRIIDGAERAH